MQGPGNVGVQQGQVEMGLCVCVAAIRWLCRGNVEGLVLSTVQLVYK